MMKAEIMINDEAYYISFVDNDEFVQKCYDMISEIADTGTEGAIIISITENGKYTGHRYLWDESLANSWIKGKIDSKKLLELLKEQYESKTKNSPVTFKIVILSRYCGEFQPATKENATIRKTSEEIKLDIRPMADLSTNEIAVYLSTHGYSIDFDDATPVWLMRKDGAMELREH